MKTLLLTAIAATSSLLTASAAPASTGPGDGAEERVERVSFETQLTKFDALGLSLNEGVQVGDISELWGEGAYENKPYGMLYMSLGANLQRAPFSPITDEAWFFDRLSIFYRGDYARVLENIERITGGELDFENVTDVVDADGERASIAFTFGGHDYAYDLVFYESYADAALLTHIVSLAKATGSERQLTQYTDGGQGLVLGWMTPAELAEMREVTGLDVKWLE